MARKSDALRFPVTKNDLPAGRTLTPDEYFAFVKFNLKHIRPRRSRTAGRDKYAFSVPFKL